MADVMYFEDMSEGDEAPVRSHVLDRTDLNSAPMGWSSFHYHTDTGYTKTANGVYSLFASDPDQSNDLGPPSGGGVAHVKVHCV